MRLYKYRDFSKPTDDDFSRLLDVLRTNAFWCARPSTLNDQDEFSWQCDCEPSGRTVSLLAQALVRLRSKDPVEAEAMAAAAVANGRVEVFAKPAFQEMINKCRANMGLACFATSPTNDVMWQRYGGQGAGVCIDIEAPTELLNQQLFRVEYPSAKILHVDQLLEACTNQSSAKDVYSVALLSKSPFWAHEEEVRFVSQRQNVSVQISGSRISAVILGSRLDHQVEARLRSLIESLPFELPTLRDGANSAVNRTCAKSRAGR